MRTEKLRDGGEGSCLCCLNVTLRAVTGHRGPKARVKGKTRDEAEKASPKKQTWAWKSFRS